MAAGGQGLPARAALEDLCRSYWVPLYAFVRRRVGNEQDARELTQGFLADLLARDDLSHLDPARGRFRSWLLAALSHFLSRERTRARRLKRGGGVAPVSLDWASAAELPADAHLDPEALFLRRWADTVLDQAVDAVRQDYAATGRAHVFEVLEPHLLGEGDTVDAAERLGLQPGAVRVAVHRVRRRMRKALRDVVARTVSDPRMVDDELRELVALLRTS